MSFLEEYYLAFDFDKSKVGFTTYEGATSSLTMGLASVLILIWSLVSSSDWYWKQDSYFYKKKRELSIFFKFSQLNNILRNTCIFVCINSKYIIWTKRVGRIYDNLNHTQNNFLIISIFKAVLKIYGLILAILLVI